MDIQPVMILSRSEVAELLSPDDCIDAVEHAFRLQGEGKAAPPGILGVHVDGGGFHIKAASMQMEKNYFVAKTNANFPGNGKKYNLPTIQGVITVSDAKNGMLLAVMDSIEVTILRTGAATAIAAKYLSNQDASIATICGCGEQGEISIKMLSRVRDFNKFYLYDIDPDKAKSLVYGLGSKLPVYLEAVSDLEEAVGKSDVVVTCTPSKRPFLAGDLVKPGTFIAAVGADNEEKQELDPGLLVAGKVVTDLIGQAAEIGELHHAITAGLLTGNDVYAQLGEVVAGKKPGRESQEEVIIFDSTGIALQDVASAAFLYEKALQEDRGLRFTFNNHPAYGETNL